MTSKTDPAPDTTLSAEDAAFVAELTAKGPLGIYGHNNALRIIRDLDAKLIEALLEREAWKNAAERYEATVNAVCANTILGSLRAERDNLAERLRVAEAGLAALTHATATTEDKK